MAAAGFEGEDGMVEREKVGGRAYGLGGRGWGDDTGGWGGEGRRNDVMDGKKRSLSPP